MSPQRFRKKPLEIEAMQFSGLPDSSGFTSNKSLSGAAYV